MQAATAQLPALQVAVALARLQRFPHAPQWFTLEFVLTSQPLPALPSQFAKLGLHALMAQLPLLQVGAAFAHRDKGRRIVTSAVEHHAVLHALDYLEKEHGFAVTRLAGEADFRLGALREALRHLLEAEPGRAERVLLSLSDPTVEPIAQAPGKGAAGAWAGRPGA